MTLIYKEFTITGTVKEIKEFIELMENKSNTVTSNLNIYDKDTSMDRIILPR